MKTYGYGELSVRGGRVTIFSTDPSFLSSSIDELKKFVPKFDILKRCKMIDGQELRVHLFRLGGRDEEVGWWMLKRFCQLGWQPFGLISDGAIVNEYHFRKEYVSNS